MRLQHPSADTWKLEAPVRKFDASPKNGEWLILLSSDHNRGNRRANLLCVNASGMERWRASLPDDTDVDFFTDVAVKEETIQAWTWSCFLLLLDPATGATTRTVFTK